MVGLMRRREAVLSMKRSRPLSRLLLAAYLLSAICFAVSRRSPLIGCVENMVFSMPGDSFSWSTSNCCRPTMPLAG